MEGTATGVLNYLSQLEVQVRSRKRGAEQLSRVAELRKRREQLEAELQTHQNLQKLRVSVDRRRAGEEEEQEEQEEEQEEQEEQEEEEEQEELLRLLATHSQLTDLLQAHRLIGGYDITPTRQGKGVCVSVETAYEGVLLETYSLELELTPALRVVRHDVPALAPPLVPPLAPLGAGPTDAAAFLETLSQRLNAFAGRKQQLKLVKELRPSVEVMESNVLFSTLRLLLAVPGQKTPVLCGLDYSDRARCLPTRVHFECADEQLPDSAAWKKLRLLLLETPVHRALSTAREAGLIA